MNQGQTARGKRLVYAQEVKEIFDFEVARGATDLFDAFDTAIESVSTVDAVEVVRCKDCNHYTPVEGGKPLCALHSIAVAHDDFCSYGERKNNG